MTWRAQLRQPVDLTVKLIEDLVFGTELDASLRAGLKNRQSVESILSTAPLFDFIEEIEKGLDESRKESVDQTADEPNNDDDGSAADDLDGAPAGELPAMVSREMAAMKAKASASGGDECEHVENMQQFVDKCWRKVDTYVVIVQEPADSNKVKELLVDTEVNRLRMFELPDAVADRRFVLINYDLKTAGEPNSHPSTRLAPLRNNGDHLKNLLRGCLAATNGDLGSRDMFLLFDGGRPGIQGRRCSFNKLHPPKPTPTPTPTHKPNPTPTQTRFNVNP